MLWTKNLTDEEKLRLNEIEDFAVNQLGQDYDHNMKETQEMILARLDEAVLREMNPQIYCDEVDEAKRYSWWRYCNMSEHHPMKKVVKMEAEYWEEEFKRAKIALEDGSLANDLEKYKVSHTQEIEV